MNDTLHTARKEERRPFCEGRHQKWRHLNGRQVIVAMHGNKQIPIGTLKSIIEGAGLTADDFR
jgi:hypothetical protein